MIIVVCNGAKFGTNNVGNIYRNYISLGDSIAAGHSINSEWDLNYGEKSQYGVNGNICTTIVPESYTDLIHSKFIDNWNEAYVSATSYARSGDTVADLIQKLSQYEVIQSIKKATVVTICIGANDVLEPAMSKLEDYINTGDLSSLETIIENNLTQLNTNNATNSYWTLFNKLTEINPKAKYVFTTVYNPYKYLYLEDGHYGFFGPLVNMIPTIEIFGLDIDSFIKDSLLGTPAVQTLFDRVNGLGDWSEKYVNRLNTVLRNKITEYQSINSNFLLAETKALFDTFPDRPISASKHYNDLVSVEYTRDYDTSTMNWGRLWPGSDAATFWFNLASKYTSLSGIDINSIATEFVQLMIEKVIVPDIDPHPEVFGQYVLCRSFFDALGWQSLDRYSISFNPNGGSGSMETQTVVGIDGLPSFVSINTPTFTPATGYYYTKWNTMSNGNGIDYANNQLISVNSNITLYAQWSNIYAVTYRHSMDSAGAHTQSDTGPMECYEFWINGTKQNSLGAFSNPAQVFYLPYGTSVGAVVRTKAGDARSYVELNGTIVDGRAKEAAYGITITGDTDFHFEWNYWLENIFWEQSYWNCYITTK